MAWAAAMRNLLRGRSVPTLVFSYLLWMLYSVIAASQVLGMLGVQAWSAVISLAVSIVAFVIGLLYLNSLPVEDERPTPFSKLDLFMGLCAVVLIVALIAVPLARWPASPAGKTLTWDAGLYHFPKAVELFRAGSMWNMNVCYAEYPLGYESLLAFALSSAKDGPASFGVIHFILALFLIASLWVLARRYTGLPSGLLLLGVVLILLSGFINKDNNPWWIYQPLLLTVGKNDLFEGAAVLAVLACAPLMAARDEKFAWNPIGFAMASMIAFSIKPNSLIILPLWLLAFYHLWKKQSADYADEVPVGYYTDNTKKDFKNLRHLRNLRIAVLMVAIALPGLLWVFRNLAAQGTLFTKAATKLTAWSIAANLTNPSLYKYIPVYLYFFAALTGIAVILAVLRKRITLPAALTLTALLVGFAVTPASAFHGNTQDRAEIAWRFGVTFISYALLLMGVVFSPLLKKLIETAGRYRVALIVLAVGALAVTGFFVWRMRPLLRYIPENAIILRDQFEQPVGTGGYYSAYDYARKNIRNSSIIVDNGLPFYAYDAAYTNTTACSGHADYFIVLNTDWAKGDPGEYPEYVSTASWGNDWDVVYEDGFSRVYKRR